MQVSKKQVSTKGFAQGSRQRGMTVLGMILLGSLLVFWVLSIIKLTPIYIEDYNIKQIFKDFEAKVKAKDKDVGTNKRKVEAYFSRFFQVNNVRDINEKDIKVEVKVIDDKPKVIVSLVHDFEEQMVGNLFFMVKGSYSVTVDKISEEDSQ